MSPADLLTQFQSYLEEAHRLKKRYASDICILVGIETEFITPLDLDELGALIKASNGLVEYVVGSIHHVNCIPIDFDLPTFRRALHSKASHEAFLCDYFDSQLTLFERLKPEIVGHFDIFRLYTPSLVLSDFPGACERMKRNVLFVIEYGGLFEVNAAAFRKGWDTAYPGKDVVQVILLCIQHNFFKKSFDAFR
jgi:histidinol-phosphatase (PHP family)